MPKTYAEAGVNVKKEAAAISELVKGLRKTLNSRGAVLGKEGHFSGLIKLDEDRALAITTDGVGSKIKVAELVGRYDTIGIDLVAMNANDLICVGATPLAMVDYLAVERVDPGIAREIAKGIAAGAEEAGVAVVGGELATLPEIINGMDLAGTMVGMVETNRIITGKDVAPGDVVVALESSGIHSNGLTLARKVLLEKHDVEDRIVGKRTVGEALLDPTKIYVKEVLDVLKRVEVKGMANITGGGLGNLCRITKYGFSIEYLPEPPEIFRLIQEEGEISEEEMYRTFNMGVGFCIIAGEGDEDEIAKICGGRGTKVSQIGKVFEGKGVRIKGKDFILEY